MYDDRNIFVRKTVKKMASEEKHSDRKVLVISYNYPPVGTIGSLRVTKIISRLPALGWYPTVLTVGRDISKPSAWDESEGVFPGVKVTRAPFLDPLTFIQRAFWKAGLLASGVGKAKRTERGAKLFSLVRRFIRWLARWGTFPDRYVLWIPFALVKAIYEIRSGDYSLIFSTSPPLTNHFIAYLLTRLTSIPWVADLRDPWAHGYLDLSMREIALHRRLERAILSRATAISAVYELLARDIEKNCGLQAGSVFCISNGFDPHEYPEDVAPLEGRFVLTFTGSVFGLKQDPGPVFEVIEELIKENFISPDEIVVRFYGPPDEELERLRRSLLYPQIMEIHGVVKRKEALIKQCESAALLVLLWDNPYTAKYFGGKIFEYLGAKRPILAWCPAGGEILSLLERTGAGVGVTSRKELKRVLIEWISQYRENKEIEYRVNLEEVSAFHWDRIAVQMAEVFQRAVSGSRHVD